MVAGQCVVALFRARREDDGEDDVDATVGGMFVARLADTELEIIPSE